MSAKKRMDGKSGAPVANADENPEGTVLKRTEQTLKESELRYRRLFETAKDGVLILDADTGVIEDVNPFLIEMLGFSREVFLGKKLWELGFFKDIAANRANFEELQRTGYVRYEDMPFESADGRRIHVEFVSNVYLVNNKKVIQCNIRDITERRRAEEVVVRTAQEWQHTFDAMSEAVWILDKDQRVMRVNNITSQYFPRSCGGFVGKHCWEIVHGTTEPIPECPILRARRSRHREALDIEVGGRSFEVVVDPILGAGGQFAGAVHVIRDVTDRKQAEEALRDSEAHYRMLFENALDGIALADAETGRLADCNPALCRMVERDRAELVGQAQSILHPPEENAEGVSKTFQQHRVSDAGQAVEDWLMSKNGRLIPVEIRAAHIVVAGRDHLLGIFRDIAERKRVEEDIALNLETEAAMNALMDISREDGTINEYLDRALDLILSLKWLVFESKGAIFLADEAGKTLHLHAHRGFPKDLLAACSTVPFGRCLCGRAAAARAVQFADRVDERHDVRHEGMSSHGHYCVPILSGDDVLGVINLYMREGHTRKSWEEDFLKVVANTFSGAIERKRADAEREKMKTQLLQVRKMEAVGQLAGGVAHDFNNMLTVILGHAEMALSKLDPSDPIHADIHEIKKAGERSADLTKQLLAFARRQIIAPKVMDVNNTIAGMLKMLNRLIGENIDLLWKPADDLWRVSMDPAQVDQILVNLMVNARDAISGVGRIVIETANVEFDAAYVKAHVGAVPGRYVRIAVSDDGCGMDKETQGRLFEPFFTTKPQGKGTGLGLATVYGIVKQNLGFIDVYSESGKGTTFKIYMPRHESEEEEEETGEARISAGAPTGTETVLLVEDEPALLELAQQLLELLGYTVLPVGSPVRAIRQATEYAGEIHLLMTDMVMPGMNGRDLRKWLGAVRPGMKCLFTSGHTVDIIAHQGVLDKGVHFLQKPFSMETLAVKLREALGETQPSP
ncbi:MAG: PAS domain S-box protein [Planctomycetota bacterium]